MSDGSFFLIMNRYSMRLEHQKPDRVAWTHLKKIAKKSPPWRVVPTRPPRRVFLCCVQERTKPLQAATCGCSARAGTKLRFDDLFFAPQRSMT